ncbi:alpha/beta hydrolase [Microlunatus sp. GCM10028923]|uniref:alpha/beta hydrolase n=1 Tax=Microlunatus sp. GCM10028923 TaxID=3273400 RepID=UPI003605C47A
MIMTPERRNRLIGLAARLIPHQDPPSPTVLRLLRAEPVRPLARVVYGPVPRRIEVTDLAVFSSENPNPRMRVYRPRDVEPGRPLLINFPGGGFVLGNLAQTDWLCGQLADRGNLTVVSATYRLAPEHPAPAAVDDAWLMAQHAIALIRRFDADPARVGVIGNSAGGTLAALISLRARHEPLAVPLWRQILLYPALDLTLSSASVAEFHDAPLAGRRVLDWYGRQYLPQGRPDSLHGADPSISPIHATDHAGLPRTLLIAAGQDPLRDDAPRYGDVLTAAGVPNRVIIYPDAVHGFLSMPRIAPDALPAINEILSELDA